MLNESGQTDTNRSRYDQLLVPKAANNTEIENMFRSYLPNFDALQKNDLFINGVCLVVSKVYFECF